MTARGRNTGDRRNQLLDAAEMLVVSRGLDSLTVDDVTGAAGVAKGTFYLYFQSKKQIVSALQERVVERLIVQQQQLLASLPEDDWFGRLEAWIQEMINAYLANAHLHDTLFHHATEDVEFQTGVSAANRHMLTLTSLLTEGTEAGAFTLDQPRINAVLLYGAIHGTLDYLLHHDKSIPTEQVIKEACELSRKMVGAA